MCYIYIECFPAAAVAAPAAAEAPKAEEKKKEESDNESDDDMGFGKMGFYLDCLAFSCEIVIHLSSFFSFSLL